MKTRYTILCLMLLLGTRFGSAATVGDEPVSVNPLVNQINGLVMSMPANGTQAQFNAQLAQLVGSPGATFSALSHFTEALRQLSKETVRIESHPKGVDRFDSFSTGNNFGRFSVSLSDRRLFYATHGSSPLQSQLAVVLSQLHQLTQPEFEAFAKSYLAMLSETQADLLVLNRLKGLKPGGERGEPLNLTFGSQMLLSLFEDPEFFKRQGIVATSTELAELQDWRVSELMSRSLNYFAFFKDQETRIVEMAQRRLMPVRGEMQAGPLATIVNGFSWRAGRKCPTLFESVTTRMYPRAQWP